MQSYGGFKEKNTIISNVIINFTTFMMLYVNDCCLSAQSPIYLKT